MICGGGGAPPIVMVGGEGSTLIEGGGGLPLIEGPRPRGSSSPGRTIFGAAGGSSGSTIWGTAGDSGRMILGASTFEGADILPEKSLLLTLPLRLLRMIRGPPRRPATETGGGSSKSMSRASVGLGRVGEGCRMGGDAWRLRVRGWQWRCCCLRLRRGERGGPWWGLWTRHS